MIIPSFRASATIAETLRSVQACREFTNAEFDITVVDSSPDCDPTRDIVRSVGFDVRLIELPERAFPGHARNIGIAETEGDVLCFIDADAVADNHWIKAIFDAFREKPDIDAFGGPVLNGNPTDNYSWLAHWCEFSGYGKNAPEGPRRVQPTVNVAIRRTAFVKFGPFLEDQFGNEDVLLFQMMKKNGSTLYFQRAQVVYHKNKTELEEIFSHQSKLGESTGVARVKYDLPGSFLQNRVISYLIPIIKTEFIAYRLLTQETCEYGRFLLKWPLVLRAMRHFHSGFLDGVKSAKEGTK